MTRLGRILTVLAVAALVGCQPTPAPTVEPLPTPSGTYTADPALDDLVRRVDGDPMARGSVEAPVVMVMYLDYLSADCQDLVVETVPALQQYVDEGILRLEVRDFVLNGDEAVTAAIGGRAAANQGAFWEYLTALMGEGNVPDGGAVTASHLEDVAAEIGIDAEQFSSDLLDVDGAAWDELLRDGNEALGVASPAVPIVVVNGVVLDGTPEVEELLDLVAWAQAHAE